MPFRFQWLDESKRVMQFVADGDWNWRDYHACARASSFSMHHVPHPVTILIDLRQSSRAKMPAGIAAHSTTFGKPLGQAQDGDAVVLAMPLDDYAKLPLNPDQTLDTPHGGTVHFVQTMEEAQAILASKSE